jgi:hypothetical protein
MSKILELTVKDRAKLTLECDMEGCENKMTVEEVYINSHVYEAEARVKRAAKYKMFDLGWRFKSFGSKGVRHYCPDCMKKPELATWKMERVLLGKDR